MGQKQLWYLGKLEPITYGEHASYKSNRNFLSRHSSKRRSTFTIALISRLDLFQIDGWERCHSALQYSPVQQ